MAEINNLRNKLRSHKLEYGLIRQNPCTEKENKVCQKILKSGGSLPEGIYPYVYEGGEVSETDFCTISEPDLTEAEIREYLTYKQLHMIKTIKNCVLFFTVLTVLSVIAYLIIMLKIF